MRQRSHRDDETFQTTKWYEGVKDGKSAAARLSRDSWRFASCIFVAFGFACIPLARISAYHPHIIDVRGKNSRQCCGSSSFFFTLHISCVHCKQSGVLTGAPFSRVFYLSCHFLRYLSTPSPPLFFQRSHVQDRRTAISVNKDTV